MIARVVEVDLGGAIVRQTIGFKTDWALSFAEAEIGLFSNVKLFETILAPMRVVGHAQDLLEIVAELVRTYEENTNAA